MFKSEKTFKQLFPESYIVVHPYPSHTREIFLTKNNINPFYTCEYTPISNSWHNAFLKIQAEIIQKYD